MVSIWIMSKLRLPQWVGPVAQPGARHGLGEIVQLIRDTPAFRNYSLAAFLFRLGLMLPMSLYSIYRVRTVGATDAWIGILFTVERVLNVVTYFALARLLSRPKWRRWLWLSCAGLAFYPFTMAFARTPVQLLIPQICSGFFSAGMTIYMSNLIYQVVPKDRCPTFVSIDATLSNVTAFAAPMLGIALMDVTGIHTALLIIAGLRVLGGLSFWRIGAGAQH
jgi:predicted MFS family arabinose efflux permease